MTDEHDDLVAELNIAASRAARDFGWDHFKFPPGKMEGNPWYIPYLYHELVLEGDGEMYCGWECSELTDEEIEAFDLEGCWAVGIREDDNGFVQFKLMTQSEYIELQVEAHAERGRED